MKKTLTIIIGLFILNVISSTNAASTPIPNLTSNNGATYSYCDVNDKCGKVTINTQNNVNEGLCVLPTTQPYSLCLGSYCQLCNLNNLHGAQLYLQCDYLTDLIAAPIPQFFLMETTGAYLIGSGPQKLHGSYHLVLHDQFFNTPQNHKNGFWPKSIVTQRTFQITADPQDPQSTGKLDIRNAYIILGCFPVPKSASTSRQFLPVDNEADSQ